MFGFNCICWYRRCGACLLAILAAAPQPVLAAAYEDGLAAYEAGEYRRAYEVWLPLAEGGNCRAQFGIGETLFTLRHGPISDTKAPSNKDRAWSKHIFGPYRDALDEPRLYWYRRAAEQGHAEAQEHIARHYMTFWGGDVSPDPSDPYFQEGFRWLHRAAENGDFFAMWQLTDYHFNSDPLQSYKWSLLLRDQGVSDQLWGWRIEHFRKTLSAAQRRAAEQQAAEWHAAHENVPPWGPC